MLKKKHLFLAAPLLCLSAVTLTGCDNNLEGDVVLRILNAEDYIYEFDEEYDVEMQYEENELAYHMDMLDQFETYWESLPENKGKDLQIVYDTYDTNETMFNELKTGKTTYDVIVPSDYMVQKLASLGMLHKLENENNRLWENISGYLETALKGVLIPDENGNPIPNSTLSDYDYCVPYMWGTLGIMYNAEYYLEDLQKIDPNATIDDVHELFKSWDCLYGEYANTDDVSLKEKYEVISDSFSIKDSVRDTYTISLIHTFDEDVKNSADAIALKQIINRHDEETISKVQEDMLNLKANAFGFETDSGKTDMTTEKIGANLCWSGDATWAITEARGEGEEDELSLYYSLPIGDPTGLSADNKSGSNIWFDCFCMPKNAKDEDNQTPEEKAQYKLGEDFIEFMSQPENAVQNCYCVGYTPAVAGDDILEYMHDCYDAEGDDVVEYNLNYFFNPDYDPEDEDTWYDEDYILEADRDMSMRELRAQYPMLEDLPRLAIMNDFGPKGNQALLDMWESVRTNPLPVWAIIVFIIEGVAAIGLVAYFVSKKVIRKKLKEAR